jgi:hypothetical protein
MHTIDLFCSSSTSPRLSKSQLTMVHVRLLPPLSMQTDTVPDCFDDRGKIDVGKRPDGARPDKAMPVQ